MGPPRFTCEREGGCGAGLDVHGPHPLAPVRAPGPRTLSDELVDLAKSASTHFLRTGDAHE